MSYETYLFVVSPDAPVDVVYHDMGYSPYYLDECDAYGDDYNDFELWVLIGFKELFFNNKPTSLLQMQEYRLSNIIPPNAVEIMTRWMDDYHTEKPFQCEAFQFWVYTDYSRDTLPEGAEDDTEAFRQDVVLFIKKAIGNRLVIR